MRDDAFSFAAEVERQIEALPRDEFHLKQGLGKRLREEWYPIARLALHLKHHGLEVFVEAFGDSGIADGRIEEKGFRNRIFDVQVTYVENHEGSLRRELMVQQGFTPGTGSIERLKPSGTIKAELQALDSDHNINQVAAGIIERFQKKTSKRYENTVLLIAFDDISIEGFSIWRQLMAVIREQSELAPSQFISVYIVNCSSNELVRAA